MRKGQLLQHATWLLCFDYGDVDVRELTRFLQEASKMLEGDFGCLTLLTETEIEAGRKNGAVSALDKRATRFNFLVSSPDIRKCLPDVYWMTVFGAPYVKMFGRDRLLSAPVHKAATWVRRRSRFNSQRVSEMSEQTPRCSPRPRSG